MTGDSRMRNGKDRNGRDRTNGDRLRTGTLGLAVLMLVAACSTIPDEDKALLAASVDCASAPQQIAELDAIRPPPGKRVVAAVGSVVPAGIVTGIAMRDYRDRVDVALGTHDEDIDAKIADIRTRCNVPDEAPA